ncbi:Glycosyl hydrolase family 20, domain 2 [Catalinimonas alkaloidigena]|uniref:Glycosyl hydrolase family 20, domain 2 n=1 Tax=Catalinimonas alkaloidigena TaxID=1075417 RepID=A0A1G9N246_9BACT|nr:glycoside hydrolase family 20 zincin-like fold domain-containing protein [Catalinimonas alkaloidigena]SDL80592.1 Glycosyl hydrolase family 20, domain 2 [Catalinimonas alkaloidigena]
MCRLRNPTLLLCFLFAQALHAQSVVIHRATDVLQAEYAARRVQEALQANGHAVEVSGAFAITLQVDSTQLAPEAFVLRPDRNQLEITGGDGRGLVYGCLSLVEALQNGMALGDVAAHSETAKLPFRAVKFDLPWDTYRHSYALTQHQETCRDLAFWEAFLDMMAENRLNALTVWNLHPYTFMIRPKDFPEASPWTEVEMADWKTLFGGIFRMARERGIDTYVMPFNIFVTPEFAKAHHVAMDNLEHHFFVRGDTSDIIKRYTRACVTQLLEEYPDLTGMGLTLGEGMGGMTPQEREDWITETIIAGMCDANRTSKLIHRIPFSGNTGSLGATTVEMEQITRRSVERESQLPCIEGPVWADLKFNWSHPLSTPKLIKVHGGKIYGTYWDPLPTDYKITWTARNEDFFCLRWGVPDFIRTHIRQNSPPYVGGYFIGSETYIPAKDYFTRPGVKTNWRYAFERQWLYYQLWGRLLYNDDTPDAVFRAAFVRRYGKPGNALFEASALAGKTPLRLAASFDCTWDFTLYSEGFMALNQEAHREEYISVDWQIRQPPLDPAYVSVQAYVDTLTAGGVFSNERVTPPQLADDLERDCRQALAQVKGLNGTDNPAFVQEVADVKAWANLGLYFAEKLRGAVALQTYRMQGGAKNQQTAIQHLEKALGYWDVVIAITRPLYQDMPLVHFSEQDNRPWQENDHLRFHWANLRPAVAHDVEIARQAKAGTP